MKLLLDTHTFVWLDTQPERLSENALAACQDPTNNLVLSVVSTWEMQIKKQLGRLTLEVSIREMVEGQEKSNDLQLLPVTVEQVYALEGLPPIHKDPFDRLLAAQADVENATLVTADNCSIAIRSKRSGRQMLQSENPFARSSCYRKLGRLA